MKSSRVVLTLVCFTCLNLFTSGQMSMSAEEEEMLESMGVKGKAMGRKDTTPKDEVVKSDLKYIRCSVCREMVEIAYSKAAEVLEKRMAFKAKRRNEVSDFDGEGEVQEFLDKVCKPEKPEGAWVASIDLVQEKDKLVLHKTGLNGKCSRECRTVERACDEALDAADESSEMLFKAVQEHLPLEKVQRNICNRAAKVCKKKAPPLEKRKDYKFQEMTADEKQMADMMANMKDSGMSGTMYRREDLAGLMDKMGDMPGMEGMEGIEGMGGAEPSADKDEV